MSETEARLLAHRMSQWLLSRPGVRGPNQVLLEAAGGRNSFVRNWRRVTKKVRLTPFDTEDLDLELEFGLALMQRGRLLRMIEEAYQQDALLSAKQISLISNITPTSLRARLQKMREQGIWVPVLGLSKKDRGLGGMLRSTWAMSRYLEGSSLKEIRRTAAMSRERLRDLLARFAGLATQVLAGNFQAQEPEEAEWMDLIRSTPRDKLKQLLYEPLSRERGDTWAEFWAELEADFALSPVKLRALREILEELSTTLSEQRPDGEVIYWAVSFREPAGKPLEACQLVPVRLTLWDPQDMPSSEEDRDLNRVSGVKLKKVLRYATQAKEGGGYLTYADLGYLLGIHTEAIRGLIGRTPALVVPLRGVECDIGRGVTHRKKIIELYLEMHTETEIVARTGHSYESVENYIKEFAAVVVLSERGLPPPLIRRVIRRSMKLVKTYLELIREHSGPEYAFRLHHLRKVFLAHEAEFKKNQRGRVS
jgi:hypothetical protein